jgi:hypothetical protein
MNHESIFEGKKPLPIEKMSLKSFDKDMSADKEKNIDKKSRLENQARMIRMAMREQRNQNIQSTNLSNLVKEAINKMGDEENLTQIGEECKDCKCGKCGKGKCECDTCPVCEKNPCICSEELKEAIKRLDAINGNLVLVMVFWRGRNYVHRMFFAQTKFPTRQEVIDQINKVYPGCRLLRYKVADFNPGMLLQVREGIDKDAMACNKPKAQAHGSGETGKSHVVKACENGKEKIIRFGQKGVKGSPKKEGESKEYASRRERFKSRHAKNIAKGKMSAAFWANKVKW